jgi:hypothetical protein
MVARQAKHPRVPLRRVRAGELRWEEFSTNSRPALRANQPGLEDVRKPHGQHRWCSEGRVAMPVPQRTSTVLRRGAFGLLVGGVILVMVLVEARQNHPGDGRCAELWNAPANQANRSVVSGHSFPLATVRGVAPNKAGQPGCSVLLREREDGPWLWFGAASSPRPRWSGTAACQAFGMGQIARPAMWMTRPTRCSSRMGALCFGDLGLLYGCSGFQQHHQLSRPLSRACQRGQRSSRTGLTLRLS